MSFDTRYGTPSFRAFLTDCQVRQKKSDQEMAEELGFSRAGVYTLIKTGAMKLPFSKVPLLAKALEQSPSDVLAVMLKDYCPELWEVVNKVWGPMDLSTNEKKLLSAYRTLCQEQDVEPRVLDGKNIIAMIMS